MTPAAYAGFRGDDAQRLGWRDEDSQHAHHAALFGLMDAHLPIAGLRVRDVGCGDGAAVSWCKARGVAGYVGVDSRPDVVNAARMRHPDHAFVCRNAASALAPVDVSFAVGTLAHHDEASARAILARMWSTSRVGIAFTAWHGVRPTAADYHSAMAVQRAILAVTGGRGLCHIRSEVQTAYFVVPR